MSDKMSDSSSSVTAAAAACVFVIKSNLIQIIITTQVKFVERIRFDFVRRKQRNIDYERDDHTC